MLLVSRSAQAAFLLTALGTSAFAQTTSLVSASSAGVPGDDVSYGPRISPDGRYVLFTSPALNLAPGAADAPGESVFLRDRASGQTSMVSVDSAGTSIGPSTAGGVSADGRYVVFETPSDVYVRDLATGVTQRAAVGANGDLPDQASVRGVLTPDGRYVAFESRASNLVAGDTNGVADVFVRDLVNGVNERVSVSTAGAQADQPCSFPSISAEGRFVAFDSRASTLVAGDPAGRDVFVHDRATGVTIRVSLGVGGAQPDHDSYLPLLSADGRVVAFTSEATNLVPGDTTQGLDGFVHDLATGATARVSVATDGSEADGPSWVESISQDGRFVGITSSAPNLVAGDTNVSYDSFLYDRLACVMSRASLSAAGGEGNLNAVDAAVSADARFVAFTSAATNVVVPNPGGMQVYVRDRGTASAFVSACAGDSAPVCPCGNAGAPGRGCENSTGGGGALLVASGVASLASDSVQVTASGAPATALSIVLQGSALVAPVAFGDGARCAGGSLLRLYVTNASGGGLTAPAASDPAISTRSAALGDPIPLGGTRVLQVYYRDADAGFCPAPQGGTFNATNAIAVAWGS